MAKCAGQMADVPKLAVRKFERLKKVAGFEVAVPTESEQ